MSFVDDVKKNVRGSDCMVSRIEVENTERWFDWHEDIPALKFDPEWSVKVVPPFTGVLVRFFVYSAKGNMVSVCLDAFDRIGISETPFWEVSPYLDDNKQERFSIYDAEELVKGIRAALEWRDKDEQKEDE